MWYNEHGPPHIHVEYADSSAIIDIETGRVRGMFPPPALRLALEWTRLRRDLLLEDWDRARAKKSLKPIEPLE
jgi:hypothetical protein